MRIAFVVNHEKTKFFLEVARGLTQSYGITSFWISPSRYWKQWLITQGVPESLILDTTNVVMQAKMARRAHPLAPEKVRLAQVIMADRILRTRDRSFAFAYLSLLYDEVRSFLEQNNIQIVFGEATWAVELIAAEAAKSIGSLYARVETVRIPYDRFSFFEGIGQRRQLGPISTDSNVMSDARQLYRKFRERPFRPKYYSMNNSKGPIPKDWLSQVQKFALMDKCDAGLCLTRPSVRSVCWERLVYQGRRALRAGSRHFVSQIDPEVPFVLYALHRQPEASIDVLGAFYSNQIELIRNIARALPGGRCLYVKEHPNCIGERDRGFYRQIAGIPGVSLVSPYVDTFQLIKKASAVITVSGTIAFEAGLLGIPAFTFAEMFFGEIPLVRRIDSFEVLSDLLGAGCDRSFSEEEIIEAYARILARSYTGIISDPRSDPECMNPHNLALVTNAFGKMIADRGFAWTKH